MSTINETLKARQNVHGEFADNSAISQELKNVVRSHDGELSDMQKEALDMIVHKISRILAGNPNHKDHWHDIAGYATLVEERI